MNWCQYAAVGLLCVFLSACGGGSGGGNGEDSSDSFTVTLNDSSVSWTYYAGSVPSAKNITATIHGTYSGQVYVAAGIETSNAQNPINPNIPIQLSSTQAVATLQPISGLPAGTYSGRIRFTACSDQSCSRTIGGTPLFVPFTVSVLVPIRATPTSLELSSISGEGVSADVAVTLGTSDASYTVQTQNSFAQISDVTSSGFRVTAPSLPPGTYHETLSLLGSAGSQFSLPISYSVSNAPNSHGLLVQPTSLTFTASEGGVSVAQTVQVEQSTWNPGLQSPEVTYENGSSGWLTLTSTAEGYQLVAVASALTKGNYSASIRISTRPVAAVPFASESVIVNVALTVGPGLIAPATVARRIVSDTTPAELTGSVAVNAVDGGSIAWTATSGSSFIQILTPTGITGQTLSYRIDEAALATTIARQETVTITPSGDIFSPVTFDISVTRDLAQITSTESNYVLVNTPAKHIIRGRGFDGVQDLAARLKVSGGTVISVDRVNDTEIIAELGPLSAGSHELTVDNALGINVPYYPINGLNAQPYDYSTAPTGGAIDVLVPVPWFREVAAVSRLTGTLRFFRYGGSGITTVTQSPISQVNNFGILAGGFGIVTTTNGFVHILNLLDKSVIQSSKVADCIVAPTNSTEGISTTNDNRAWIVTSTDCSSGPSPWHRLNTLQYGDSTLQPFDLGPSATLYAGPDFLLSGNRERMILRQSQSVSPLPPMLYLDARDSVVHQAPETVRWQFSATSNHDGSRWLLDAATIVDGQFSIFGRLRAPDYAAPSSTPYPVAGVLSRDGTRAYVLVYRSSDVGSTATSDPRVYVFDTTNAVGDQPLPVLGFFEISDYPSCIDNLAACDLSPPAAISFEGTTLFFGGDERVVIAPIPQAYQ